MQSSSFKGEMSSYALYIRTSFSSSKSFLHCFKSSMSTLINFSYSKRKQRWVGAEKFSVIEIWLKVSVLTPEEVLPGGSGAAVVNGSLHCNVNLCVGLGGTKHKYMHSFHTFPELLLAQSRGRLCISTIAEWLRR